MKIENIFSVFLSSYKKTCGIKFERNLKLRRGNFSFPIKQFLVSPKLLLKIWALIGRNLKETVFV